jgi:hypothetical protein
VRRVWIGSVIGSSSRKRPQDWVEDEGEGVVVMDPRGQEGVKGEVRMGKRGWG